MCARFFLLFWLCVPLLPSTAFTLFQFVHRFRWSWAPFFHPLYSISSNIHTLFLFRLFVRSILFRVLVLAVPHIVRFHAQLALTHSVFRCFENGCKLFRNTKPASQRAGTHTKIASVLSSFSPFPSLPILFATRHHRCVCVCVWCLSSYPCLRCCLARLDKCFDQRYFMCAIK